MLLRRFERERKARKQAEGLLEKKSLELFNANKELRELANDQERLIEQRTGQLVKARDEAIQANRHKSDFLSRMSHELRTPMNAILGFSQLLESDPAHPLSEDQHENLSEIMKAGRHLLELINEVLDLSKIEAGKLELMPEEVSPTELMEECLLLIKPMAEQKDIRLINHLEKMPACLLYADRMRLKQVLLNLLSNAVKYNHDLGSVEIEPPEVVEKHLRICIRDTGPGIAADALPRLFEPFSRVSNDSGIEGTGIGLTISKLLMEMMGGHIGVESKPGKGSRFWIDVSCGDAATNTAESKKPAEESPQRIDAGVSTEKAFTLLYVEDNPANLKLVKLLMKRRGDNRLLEAENAELGLEMALARRPDIILMDLQLPGMSGIEALQKLRATAEIASIPTIALSANAMPADIQRGLDAGFDAYLTKPIKVVELMDTLDGVLANPRVQ